MRTLVRDGNQFAQRLGLSAAAYHDQEQYAEGVLKDAVNTAVGDPHATDQQVENESFGQILAADQPDYSAASWDKAGHDMAATWQAEGRDVLEGPMGLNKTMADAAGQGQAFTRVENDAFGSPPAEQR